MPVLHRIRVSCPFEDCESAYKYQKYLGNPIRDVHAIDNKVAQTQAATVYQAAFVREAENQRKDQEMEVRQRRSALEIFHAEPRDKIFYLMATTRREKVILQL